MRLWRQGRRLWFKIAAGNKLCKKWQKTPEKNKKEVKEEGSVCLFLLISDTLLLVSVVPSAQASHQYLHKRGVS